MTPADLSLTVLHAVRSAVDEGALRVAVPERVTIERPRPGGRGDYASNVALTLARAARRTPLDVAATLRDRLHATPALAAVEITGPGFLNFTLRQEAQQDLVREILRQGDRYGRCELSGERTSEHAVIRHRADVRAAVTADALRRILLSQGVVAHATCEGPVASDWGLLGVETPATVAEQSSPDIAPVPSPYTSRELLHRLGVDAARWGLLSAAAHDRARLGDDLLHQHEGNPLFRVRYAHSRTRALLRNAEQLGFDSAAERHVEDGRTLAGLLGDHPLVLASAARHRAPDRVARHLEATADALLDFQHTVLPLGDEKPSAAHRSRLALAEAAGVVLAGGLSLLGISAPDQM
ncbi:ArgS-related anticodon-binding protein NrtL [Streptomyces sp. NPDC003035]|uniref:ArgS-related anticodon-binding protein NrtL n=1 Tax=Streptomyces sp. NPDC003035 TaxID=3364676 RepID=UPI00368B107E